MHVSMYISSIYLSKAKIIIEEIMNLRSGGGTKEELEGKKEGVGMMLIQCTHASFSNDLAKYSTISQLFSVFRWQ